MQFYNKLAEKIWSADSSVEKHLHSIKKIQKFGAYIAFARFEQYQQNSTLYNRR